MISLEPRHGLAEDVYLRRCPHRPTLQLPLHISHNPLHRLQNPIPPPQSRNLPILMLNSTLSAKAFQTTNFLRPLVFVLLLRSSKGVSVDLAAIFSKFAQRSHQASGVGFQFRFELVSLGATAFEAVAELEGAGVALAGVFVRGAVGADAGWHGGC
jgi:hypothetical protein